MSAKKDLPEHSDEQDDEEEEDDDEEEEEEEHGDMEICSLSWWWDNLWPEAERIEDDVEEAEEEARAGFMVIFFKIDDKLDWNC